MPGPFYQGDLYDYLFLPVMKLLVIENDSRLLKNICHYFLRQNFISEGVTNLDDARRRIDHGVFDCIIADIDIPGGNALQLLNDLQAEKNDAAVIIVSVSHSPDDKIRGLREGADDYLTKPFELSELAARVKAVLRRRYADGHPILDLGVLRIDLVACALSVGGKPVRLSSSQFALLLLLARNKDRFVSSEVIAEYLHNGSWEEAPRTDFVYRHIKNLKLKLKKVGYPEIVKTSYRFGYKLDVT
jgi:DNA-binding response OmpR family regulator